jgi:NAD dependent epimerase/dehydratase family
VCHLAGLTKVRDSRTNPVDYWRTNVGGNLAILHRLADAHAGRVVLASTCAVYGEQTEQPITETTPVAPSSPYGRSKLAADHAAADLAATGAIGAISLRAFNVAGALPGHPDRDTTRLIPQLLAVQQGRAPELVINGDGTAVRDFVHVADMATAFTFALCACGLAPGAPTTSAAATPALCTTSSLPPRQSPDDPSHDGTPPPRTSPRHCWPTAPASGPSWAGDRKDQPFPRSSPTRGAL